MLFKHFILTRFNVVGERLFDVSYDYVNSDEYLSQRFHLFDTYCFPSISKQSNSNFTWLLLFNEQLPEKWREKLKKYKEKCPNMEICYMNATSNTKWQYDLNQLITQKIKVLNTEPKFILTTRIDNDDMFHLSLVDAVQKYFLEHREEANINYINGLQYIPKYNILKNLTFADSHFGTLIEKNTENLRTVLSFSHVKPLESFKVVYLKDKTQMWIEIAHSTNVLNAVLFQAKNLINDLFFIGFKYKNLNDFGVKQTIPRFNFYTWIIFFEWFFGKFKEKIINKFTRK